MATEPLPVHGVDISHHQSGTLDLAGAKKRGLKWLYHKATEGNSFVDNNYTRRRAEAKAAGLPFGAYHFARAEEGDAVVEARQFISVAKPVPGDLRPALDLETTEGLGMDQIREWAAAFIAEVERLTGFKPIVYTPFDLGSADDGCIIWRPRYNNSNTPPVLKWDVWQFSNGVLGVPHSVQGIGNVDLNVMRPGLTIEEMLIPVPVVKTSGIHRLITQNVQSIPLMPQDEVVHDVKLTASEAGLVGWQEMQPIRYRGAVTPSDFGDESPLDVERWATYFHRWESDRWYDSPISWRTGVWNLVDSGGWLLHRLEKGICGDRWMTWVLLRNRSTGALVMVHNGHYVAGAWNKSDDDPREARRKEMWADAQKRHKLWVETYMRANPSTAVIGMGDYNRQLLRGSVIGNSILGKKVHNLVGPKSIDHLWVVASKDGSVSFEIDGFELLEGRFSDHQGRRGRVKIVHKV